MSEKKQKKFSVKYVGESPSVMVPGFFDGKGYYEKEEIKHFTDPEEIQQAKDLVESNPNFEEVEK